MTYAACTAQAAHSTCEATRFTPVGFDSIVSARSGIVLVSIGVGVAVFFVTLSIILHERDVLSGAAAAIIPCAIGVGLLIDAGIQAREISSGAMSR